jgi:hypothetical protein
MYRPYMSSLSDTRPFRDVQSQIRDLTQDFATAFNTGNYDQAAVLFASDGVLMVPTSRGGVRPKVCGAIVETVRRGRI